MKINKIKNTPYNPRKMSDASQGALKVSMATFQDISGIVWNSYTGNLVSGNHRWDELKEKHGDSLELVRMEEPMDDYCMIMGTGEFTNYILREVDWDEETEKAANIAANSEKIQGEFTNAIKDLLDDIGSASSRLPKITFDALRLNELALDFAEVDIQFDTSNEFDLDDDFGDDFDESELHTKSKDVLLSDEDDTVEMAVIKVRCPMSKRTQVSEMITNALINENDIKIS